MAFPGLLWTQTPPPARPHQQVRPLSFTSASGPQTPTSVMGLPSVLPVSGQRGMVLTALGSARPLRCLGADKELTAWNLWGSTSKGEAFLSSASPPQRTPPQRTDLVRGRGVGRALRQGVVARVGVVVTIARRDICRTNRQLRDRRPGSRGLPRPSRRPPFFHPTSHGGRGRTRQSPTPISHLSPTPAHLA